MWLLHRINDVLGFNAGIIVLFIRISASRKPRMHENIDKNIVVIQIVTTTLCSRRSDNGYYYTFSTYTPFSDSNLQSFPSI